MREFKSKRKAIRQKLNNTEKASTKPKPSPKIPSPRKCTISESVVFGIGKIEIFDIGIGYLISISKIPLGSLSLKREINLTEGKKNEA